MFSYTNTFRYVGQFASNPKGAVGEW